ncbi:MAG: hypothetical protein QXE38_05305 [Candidatus Methanomethylicia archaeon]
MFTNEGKDVKLLDIVNLAEEKLGNLIKDVEKSKGNRRIKGLIIYHHSGYDLHLDFRGGKPSLAIMKNNEKAIYGNECWEKISEIKDKVAGVVEVYEVSEMELSKCEEENPNAIISSEEIKGVKTHVNINDYSVKMLNMPLIRNLILKDKEQLKEEINVLESMKDISKVVEKVIAESKSRILYMFVNFLGMSNWKSFDILLKNGEVISTMISGVNKVLTGKNALNEIMKLNKTEGEYIVFLYELKEEDLELLNKDEAELKKTMDKISFPKIIPKAEEERRKPRKIVMVEPVKIDLEKVRDRASEYFKSSLEGFGYIMEDLKVDLINGTVTFQVKIKKKGFSLKRVKLSDVEGKLVDDAQWVMKSIGYNAPIKVNIS